MLYTYDHHHDQLCYEHDSHSNKYRYYYDGSDDDDDDEIAHLFIPTLPNSENTLSRASFSVVFRLLKRRSLMRQREALEDL